MTQVNNWIIALINRLHVQFPHCGYAYSYEALSDQHVIELTDADLHLSPLFRSLLLDELDEFNHLFKGHCILFTDQENDFPLEPPILYKKQPVMEATLSDANYIPNGYSSVTWMPEWKSPPSSVNEILSSVTYTIDIYQQEVVTVATKAIVVGDYNYVMAA